MAGALTLGIRLRADGSDLVGAVRVSRRELDGLSRTTDRAGRSADRAAHEFTGLGRSVSGLGVGSLIQEFTSLQGVLAGLGLGLVGHELLQTQLRADNLRVAFGAITGSAAAGARELAFLRAESERLGLNFNATAQAYKGLFAASRGTALEGAAVREVFISIAEASSVLRLSADETSRALLAVSQMISKGTVSAEELRQQLGEALPGAFQIAARAMGVSTAELGKMLERGELLAVDFLPRLAREMNRTFSSGQGAVGGLNSELNRLANSWERFKEVVGDPRLFSPVVQGLTWLSEASRAAFHNMRRSAFHTFGAIEKGINLLSRSFRVMAAFFSTTWQAMLNGARNIWIGFLEGIAQGMEWVPGLREQAASVRRFADAMAAAKTDTNAFFATAKRINDEFRKENAAIDANVRSLVRDEIARSAVVGPTERMTAALKEQVGALKGRTQAAQESAKALSALAKTSIKATEGQIALKEKMMARAASAHSEALSRIRSAQISLMPAYEQAVARARQWRNDTMALLKLAGKDHGNLAAQVEDVFQRRMVQAMEKHGQQTENWLDGVRSGFDEYSEKITNAAQEWETVTGRAMRSMEDAIVGWARTGKFEVRDMVDSILSDLVRLQVRQHITGPLSSMFSATAGGASAGQGSFFGGLFSGIGSLFGGLFHDGGIVGLPGPARQVPAAAFAGAPRFHGGGVIGPGEVPIIARHGEGVFTPEQMANLAPARAAGPVTLNFDIDVDARGAEDGVDQRIAAGVEAAVRRAHAEIADDFRRNGPLARQVRSVQ